jgi:hypothetical protein
MVRDDGRSESRALLPLYRSEAQGVVQLPWFAAGFEEERCGCLFCLRQQPRGRQALEAGKSVARGRLGEIVQTFRTAHKRFSVTRFTVTGFRGGGADGGLKSLSECEYIS